jgi:uncharacterized protein (TIGR02757 family)
LQNIYKNHKGLENVFTQVYIENNSIKEALIHFRKIFFEIPHLKRSEKHISNVLKNSSAKRLNMMLRWLVRNNKSGVDFGIWKNIKSSDLMMPLDVHTGNVSRKHGLLTRKQDDWKAVEELTENLRKLNPSDPILYDFALFGLGVFENVS